MTLTIPSLFGPQFPCVQTRELTLLAWDLGCMGRGRDKWAHPSSRHEQACHWARQLVVGVGEFWCVRTFVWYLPTCSQVTPFYQAQQQVLGADTQRLETQVVPPFGG